MRKAELPRPNECMGTGAQVRGQSLHARGRMKKRLLCILGRLLRNVHPHLEERALVCEDCASILRGRALRIDFIRLLLCIQMQ